MEYQTLGVTTVYIVLKCQQFAAVAKNTGNNFSNIQFLTMKNKRTHPVFYAITLYDTFSLIFVSTSLKHSQNERPNEFWKAKCQLNASDHGSSARERYGFVCFCHFA